jgi:hypothetical protein
MTGRKESAYYAEAERLYVQEDLTLEGVREALQGAVSVTTLSLWKVKGGWERKRETARTAPKDLAGRLRKNLLRQIEDLEASERLDTGAYDAIYKTFLLLEKMDKTQDLRTLAIPVMQAFTRFLKAEEVPPGELQLFGDRIRAWFRSLE